MVVASIDVLMDSVKRRQTMFVVALVLPTLTVLTLETATCVCLVHVNTDAKKVPCVNS